VIKVVCSLKQWPKPEVRPAESAVSSLIVVRSGAPEEVGFLNVFWGFKNQQFLSATNYSAVIVEYDSFSPGWVQMQQGVKPRAGAAESLATPPHYNHCKQVITVEELTSGAIQNGVPTEVCRRDKALFRCPDTPTSLRHSALK